MTSVTATFQDPKVAAVVADSVVKKLQEYIIDYLSLIHISADKLSTLSPVTL